MPTFSIGQNGSAEDPYSLKIANDSQYVYFDIDYATPVNPQTDNATPSGSGLYLGIDSDNNFSTGYPVNGSIGANAAFQNNFPFTEGPNPLTGFNTGGTLTSDIADANNFGNLYLASPYYAQTSYQLISLPIDLYETDTVGGFTGYVFNEDSTKNFTLEFYTNGTGNDVILGPVNYTLASAAAVPEPTSFSLLAIGCALPLMRRRRNLQAVLKFQMMGREWSNACQLRAVQSIVG